MTIRIERRNAGRAEPRASFTRPLLASALLALALAAGTSGAEAASATAISIGSSSSPALPGSTVVLSSIITAYGGGPSTIDVHFFADYVNFAVSNADPHAVGVGRTLSIGASHSCAVTTAGGVQCWGRNDVGQLGDGTLTDRTSPVDVSGLTGIAAVTAGTYHSCALTTAGGVKCWGNNFNGQLGNGKTTVSTVPVDVVGLTSGVVAVAAGSFHTCALTVAGGVKCWGRGWDGQIGDGDTSVRITPVDVAGLTADVVAITAGSDHSCAVTSAGAAMCWGNNQYGQLGTADTSITASAVPIGVDGLTSGVTMVSAGGVTTCAVVGGAAKCWGFGFAGQLGNGAYGDSPTPVAVSNLTSGVATVSVGSTHVCAVTTAGAAACWGLNDAGELGNGTTTLSTIPVPVTTLTGGVASISAANAWYGGSGYGEHSCALLLTGEIRCWGLGAAGQIGVGSTDGHTQPVALASPTAAVPSAARASISTLAAGTYPISAGILSDATHDGGNSGNETQIIGALASSVTVVSSRTALVCGETVTFTAAITSTGATPSGSITFVVDDAAFGSPVALESGRASLEVSSLGGGYHTIRAAYGGDELHAAAVSRTIVQKIDPGSTTVTLTPATTTIATDGSVTLTATVAAVAPSTASPNGGVVYFRTGSSYLAASLVSNGTASATVSGFPVGVTRVTAVFRATTDLAEATSNAATVTVDARSGSQFRANTRTLGSQQLPAVATLTGGGFVVVWASKDQDGSSWGIYGQRYSAAGAKAGAEFRVNSMTSNAQSYPVIAATIDGGFVTSWLGSDARGKSTGVRAQRWTATGAKAGAEFRVDTKVGSQQSAPSIAASPAGGFRVTWVSNTGSGATYDVRSQAYAATGRKLGGEVKINAVTLPSLTSPATVTALDDGTWAVAWTRAAKVGAKPIVVAQRLTTKGVRSGAEIAVTSATFAQSDPVVARMSGEGFVVAWVSQGQDGSGKGIYAQRYSAAGDKRGSAFLINQTVAGDQSEPALATRPGGGLYATWTSVKQDGSGKGIYGRAYTIGGWTDTVEFRLNTTTRSNQSQPAMAGLSSSDFVAVWTSVGTDGGLEGVYGQRFHLPTSADRMVRAAGTAHPRS